MTATLILLCILLGAAMLPMPSHPGLWMLASWGYALATLIGISVLSYQCGWGA